MSHWIVTPYHAYDGRHQPEDMRIDPRRSRCVSEYLWQAVPARRSVSRALPRSYRPAFDNDVCHYQSQGKQEREHRESTSWIVLAAELLTLLDGPSERLDDAKPTERRTCRRRHAKLKKRDGALNLNRFKGAPEPDDRGRGMMLGGMWVSTEPEQTINYHDEDTRPRCRLHSRRLSRRRR